eukprot:scaffold142364_cov30-Attheya_sp.AAC.1
MTPIRAPGVGVALPLPPTPHHKKQQTALGSQHLTMVNSTPPVANLPAAPILDALPDTASPDYPMTLARRSARLTMKAIFDKIPFPWQENIIAHLNMMRMPRHGIPPAAVLLIQPTGGGSP